MKQPDLLSPVTVAELDRARALHDAAQAAARRNMRAYSEAMDRAKEATTRALRGGRKHAS